MSQKKEKRAHRAKSALKKRLCDEASNALEKAQDWLAKGDTGWAKTEVHFAEALIEAARYLE
jgi:hypothetical protein